MSTQTRHNRQPAGTPSGGQFAAGSTGEPSGVALSVYSVGRGDTPPVVEDLEACDTCGGSLAELKSPNVKRSCVECTGESDYDFPALHDDSLDSGQKIQALAEGAAGGEIDVRWAHTHSINMDDGEDPDGNEARFDEALKELGTDWDTLLERDRDLPEDEAHWAYDPVTDPGADYEAELDGELEALNQYVRAERTAAAAEQVVAKVEAMPGLALPVPQRRAEVMSMFSGDETLAAQARHRLISGRDG